MFCEKCGTAIDEDAVFCPECGALVRESDSAYVTPKKQNGWIIGVSIAGGVLALLLLIGVMFSVNNSKYIALVKNGHPMLYPDTTYNEAFSSFFSEPKWEYFKSEAEEDIVEFRGKCFLLDSDMAIKMTVQFVVDEDDDVAFHTLSLDGKEQSDFLSVLILAGIFEKYEDGNSDGKLEMPEEEEDSNITENDFAAESEEDYEDTEYDNYDETDEDYAEYGYLVADNENLYGDMAHFALYDLDNDGIEELIVQGGNSFADTMNKVYTIADNQAEYLGEFAGPVSLFPAESGIGLYASYSRMDNTTMYYVLKSEGTVQVKEITNEHVKENIDISEELDWKTSLDDDFGIDMEAYKDTLDTDDYSDDATEDNGDYYIFEDSDTRMLKNSELKGCDTETLRLGRNEIYARHGRRFLDEELQSYFDSMPWYEGTIEPEDFKESVLNKYEKKNLKKIARFENR